jgi:hypothetical protein
MPDFIANVDPIVWYIITGVGVFAIVSLLAIRDAFFRDFGSPQEKMFWVQLSVLVPILGGIVYFLFGRKRGRKP